MKHTKKYHIKYALLREWVHIKNTVEANPDAAFMLGLVAYYGIKYFVCA